MAKNDKKSELKQNGPEPIDVIYFHMPFLVVLAHLLISYSGIEFLWKF